MHELIVGESFQLQGFPREWFPKSDNKIINVTKVAHYNRMTKAVTLEQTEKPSAQLKKTNEDGCTEILLERFSKMCHIWRSKELNTTLKLRLCAAAVASVLVYGCEAWPISEKVTKWLELGVWNARRLSIIMITYREIRDEYLI